MVARNRRIGSATLGLVLTFAVPLFAFGADDHVLTSPDTVKWSAGPPDLPKGAEIAVIAGDPGKEGAPFVIRARLPAGYRIAPHTHPGDEYVTVLSGTFHIGMGDRFDAKLGRAMPAGTFGTWPAGMTHFVWAEGETTVQFHGDGPWTISYVNPDDDPRGADKS